MSRRYQRYKFEEIAPALRLAQLSPQLGIGWLAWAELGKIR